MKLGQDHLVPYYADILGALLPCIADKEEKIRAVSTRPVADLPSVRILLDDLACSEVARTRKVRRRLKGEDT